MNKKPSVSLLTITQYSRNLSLQILVDMIKYQTYKNIIEWVIIEGSKNEQDIKLNQIEIEKLKVNSGLSFPIVYIDNTLGKKLGELRNIGNTTCKGDITVCMDDDDYYPSSRVNHAVKTLTNSKCLIAGCTKLLIYDYNLNKLFISNGFGKYHSTNACMAWKKEYLKTNSHDITKDFGEEQSFTKNFTEKMEQLEPNKTIIASSHNINTFNKKKILVGSYFTKNNFEDTGKNIESLMDLDILAKYKKIFKKEVETEYDFIIFCGGYYKECNPSDKNTNNEIYLIRQLAERLILKNKKVAVYGEFTEKQVINNVLYEKWCYFPYDSKLKTVIINSHYGLNCFAPFNVKYEKLWLEVPDMYHQNYFNIIEKYNISFDKVILKSNYQQIFFNKLKNIKIIPYGMELPENEIVSDMETRNPFRFCFCNNHSKGLEDLLTRIWPVIYNYEPKAELHIYNAFDSNDNENFEKFKPLMASAGVMYHGTQSINLVMREKKLSTYEFIMGNHQDVDNVSLRQSLLLGCIPIMNDIGIYSNMRGYKLNRTNRNIHPIEIIGYLKKNNPLKIDFKELDSSLFDNWEKTVEKYLE